MKISNEQLIALQESEARQNKQAPVEGFDALLAGQLGQGQAQGIAPAMDMRSAMVQGLIPTTLPQQIQGVNATGAASAVPSELDAAMQRMDNLFTRLEGYAGQLSSSTTDSLRSAYSTLEGMTNEIASLKEAFPQMESRQPELAAMVNELDVLTRTETFKFNRGDYL